MNNNLKEIIEFFKNKYKAKKGDIVLISDEDTLYLCKIRNDNKIDVQEGIKASDGLLMLKQSDSPLNVIMDYAAGLIKTNNISIPEEESLQPSESIIITNEGKDYRCLKLTKAQFNLINVSFDYINSALKEGLNIKQIIEQVNTNKPKQKSSI